MNTGTLAVIGLGYIGLPTAAVFAMRGWKVVGVDVNPAAVRTINEGRSHFVEPDLEGAVMATVRSGQLRATTAPEPADVFVIAVPTPFKAGHEPDLQYIEAAAHSIAPVLRPGNLIVLESTSPVGATEQLVEWLAQSRADLRFPRRDRPGELADIYVSHCPERVLPGKVLHELVHNDRVIGGITPRCAAQAAKFYSSVASGECITTDARTAELCKLAENSFRDVNIAFANEMSLVCDRLGVDVWELITLANRHPRVNILQPGPGVGGHCIAVDPWFIVNSAPEQARLVRTAREVNDAKPHWVIQQVKTAVAGLSHAQSGSQPRPLTVACLGLAFKPDIDDLRESPALEIALALSHEVDATVIGVEPNITALPQACDGAFALLDLNEALAAADVVLLLVDHSPFKVIEPAALAGKTVIDTRGVWR